MKRCTRHPRPTAWAMLAASSLLAACATEPARTPSVELPTGIVDARGRFTEIFCEVLERRGESLHDYRPCSEALSPASLSVPRPGQPVELGPARRPLVAALVGGIGFSCFVHWLQPPGTAAAHVRAFGYDAMVVEVDAFSGTERNAQQIRDAIMAMPDEPGPARLVLVGYSKGAPDVLEALVRYPEIHDRIAAVLSVSGAIGGSALAEDATQQQAELLRHWPGAECDRGDGGAVESLRPAVRHAWLASHPLPPGLRYYSLVTLPEPDRVSRAIRSSYRKLGKLDWRNDSQVIYRDQIVPGSVLLGFLNADHWAVTLPIERSHAIVGTLVVDKNDYPREALLEAVLRFIDEDLATHSGAGTLP